ncbi:uncharacterized protein LOC123252351 [Gracilinanus agilis]|uniref:uncharacterized protein LOC123252351 n=1 Tax=Gracilinanus agilis TaxID=191870 RepID=UPI001CFE7C31|nr:uncharacterized protein LOC123252351 [Gracilinanus agilis]
MSMLGSHEREASILGGQGRFDESWTLRAGRERRLKPYLKNAELAETEKNAQLEESEGLGFESCLCHLGSGLLINGPQAWGLFDVTRGLTPGDRGLAPFPRNVGLTSDCGRGWRRCLTPGAPRPHRPDTTSPQGARNNGSAGRLRRLLPVGHAPPASTRNNGGVGGGPKPDRGGVTTTREHQRRQRLMRGRWVGGRGRGQKRPLNVSTSVRFTSRRRPSLKTLLKSQDKDLLTRASVFYFVYSVSSLPAGYQELQKLMP